jgi:RNA polymerase sigma-70 factor (ECF subfamily)
VTPRATPSEGESDAALLERVGGGDEAALACLYERYAPVVFGFVRRRVPDRELAEEVCGDVWLGCWRSARAFRGDSRVLTWLLGIASRQVIMSTRGRRRPTVPLDEDLEVVAVESDDPAAVVADAAGAAELTAAIQQLPAELYEVVVLAWLHELPYSEIAGAVGIPVGTVKSRMMRARRLLQARVGERNA